MVVQVEEMRPLPPSDQQKTVKELRGSPRKIVAEGAEGGRMLGRSMTDSRWTKNSYIR